MDSLGRWTICIEDRGFKNWWLGLFISQWICIRIPVWTNLTEAWMKMGKIAWFISPKNSLLWETTHATLVPRLAGTKSHLKQEGPSRNWTWRLRTREHRISPEGPTFSFLQIWTPLTSWQWPWSPNFQESQKAKGEYLHKPKDIEPEISRFHSLFKILCLWTASTWLCYWHAHSEEGRSKFAFWKSVSRGMSRALCLVKAWRQVFLICTLGWSVNYGQKTHVFVFSHLGTDLRWPAHCSL